MRDNSKKIVFDLNKQMEETGVRLSFEEQDPMYGTPHSGRIKYDSPFEYRASSKSLRFEVNEQGVLAVKIGRNDGIGKSEQMKLADFNETIQLEWVLNFLDETADGPG